MKLWGGRFSAPPADALDRLGKSVHFDRRLHAEEIRVNQAYARALAAAGVLSSAELDRMLAGLDRVGAVLAADPPPPLDDEDIHTAVERLLSDEIGELARKLPTGRSRNDLSQTEFRLYLGSAISTLVEGLDRLRTAVLARAEASQDTLVPGYTHLQRAQPVVFGHLLLAHFWALTRDRERLEAAGRRADASPMGAGALAGNPYPVDRRAIADELGLAEVLENSVDAVGTRDYAMEFLAAGAILGVQLSRLAEDLVLWSSAEFGFVRLGDAWSTGSSLMPQKRNPDGCELIRGKAGRLIGNLVALLTVGKGLASGYQRDLQEDKEPCFDTLDTLRLALPVAEGHDRDDADFGRKDARRALLGSPRDGSRGIPGGTRTPLPRRPPGFGRGLRPLRAGIRRAARSGSRHPPHLLSGLRRPGEKRLGLPGLGQSPPRPRRRRRDRHPTRSRKTHAVGTAGQSSRWGLHTGVAPGGPRNRVPPTARKRGDGLERRPPVGTAARSAANGVPPTATKRGDGLERRPPVGTAPRSGANRVSLLE